MADGI